MRISDVWRRDRFAPAKANDSQAAAGTADSPNLRKLDSRRGMQKLRCRWLNACALLLYDTWACNHIILGAILMPLSDIHRQTDWGRD